MEFRDCIVLSWNVRGALSKRGQRHIKDMVRKYKPTIVCLMETHCPFYRARKFWEDMGYHDVAVVEAQGHSGGLWVLVQQNSYTFSIFDVFSQMITFKVACGRMEWMCSCVYASPIPSVRNQLWDYILAMRDRVNIPWFLTGDFNEALLPSEVRGGNFSFHRAGEFGRVLEAGGLMDMGAIGNKFTWVRRVRGGRLVSKKLDRVLIDYDWRQTFPEAFTEILPRIHSDHSPLLV